MIEVRSQGINAEAEAVPPNLSPRDCSAYWTMDQRVEHITTVLKQSGHLERVSREFAALQHNYDRIKYLDELDKARLLGSGVTTVATPPAGKCVRESDKWRTLGNSSFQRRHYRAAMGQYTRSLVTAPLNSLQEALAFGNRSAASFRLLTAAGEEQLHSSAADSSWTEQLRLAAVSDVGRALESQQYPPHKRYMLWRRLANLQVWLGHFFAAETSLVNSIKDARLASLTREASVALLDDVDSTMSKCTLSRVQRLFDHPADSDETKPSSSFSYQHQSKRKTLPEPLEGFNKSLPYASSTIRMEWSEDRGRKLVACRDLNPGDTVIVESPYCWCLSASCWLTHCHSCARRAVHPLPCATCSNVVFCSEACRLSCGQRIHSAGCHLLASVQLLDAGHLATLAVEAALTAGAERLRLLRRSQWANCQHRDIQPTTSVDNGANDQSDSTETDDRVTAEDDSESADASDSGQTEAFDDLSSRDQHCSARHLEAFRLQGHSQQRTVSDLFRRAVTALVLSKLVTSGDGGASGGGGGQHESQLELGAGILHYMQSLPCNAHPISELCWGRWPDGVGEAVGSQSDGDGGTAAEECEPVGGPAEVCEVGAAVYPTVSLMNHACVPSVLRVSCDGAACAVRVLRPVARGEELLDNYGQHAALHPLVQRQRQLRRQYWFTCSCEACTVDWPLLQALPDTEPELTEAHQLQQRRRLAEWQLQQSRDGFERDAQLLAGGQCPASDDALAAHLLALFRHTRRPSRQYSRCQEALKLYYLTAGNTAPVSDWPSRD